MPIIQMKNLRKVYNNEVEAIKNLNLEVNEGEFLVLLGPSGCGKSTLLRMIAGLEEVTEGEIYIRNKLSNDISPVNRNISLVFQNYALYAHMPVYQNIGFSLMLNKETDDHIYEEVMKNKDVIDITNEELKRLPTHLSGGQRQRVALGRAITKKTELLLMDEPLSNLDAKLRGVMRKEIYKLYHNLKKTIVYVTHDQLEAMTMATKIVIMDQGVIQQVGAPLELYHRPQNLFVAKFLGSLPMNLIAGKFDKKTQTFVDDAKKINLPFKNVDISKLDDETDAKIGFRAEKATITKELDKADIICDVSYVEFLGRYQNLHLNYGNNNVIINTSGSSEYHAGDKVGILLNAEDILLFNKNSGELMNLENSN